MGAAMKNPEVTAAFERGLEESPGPPPSSSSLLSPLSSSSGLDGAELHTCAELAEAQSVRAQYAASARPCARAPERRHRQPPSRPRAARRSPGFEKHSVSFEERLSPDSSLRLPDSTRFFFSLFSHSVPHVLHDLQGPSLKEKSFAVLSNWSLQSHWKLKGGVQEHGQLRLLRDPDLFSKSVFMVVHGAFTLVLLVRKHVSPSPLPAAHGAIDKEGACQDIVTQQREGHLTLLEDLFNKRGIESPALALTLPCPDLLCAHSTSAQETVDLVASAGGPQRPQGSQIFHVDPTSSLQPALFTLERRSTKTKQPFKALPGKGGMCV
ncbi:hypothetical protein DNTS_020577 [Danionella cerebrum]|uniref:Uncharacterized protein n=1 Tax=Danionella cerebrum TaxID=2873325 RepID=A0A553R545_9TELE|nr:hypothetical protein DNTS_020577 [Danionella translucida]